MVRRYCIKAELIEYFYTWGFGTACRAHYTICVLSYLLNISVTNRLREANIDIKSSQKTYEILRDGIIGKMSLKSTGEESLNLMQLQSQQKMILELFQCEGIVEKNYLKSIGVNH